MTIPTITREQVTEALLDLISLAYPGVYARAVERFPRDRHAATEARVWCHEARILLRNSGRPVP